MDIKTMTAFFVAQNEEKEVANDEGAGKGSQKGTLRRI